MVLLTMTPSMVESLKKLQKPTDVQGDNADNVDGEKTTKDDEPQLTEPAVGKPISHAQVLDTWKALRALDDGRTLQTTTLEQLLVGSKVYAPPPTPKPEPSASYKALMVRLRREEEARAYQRLVNPPEPYELTNFAKVNRPSNAADAGDGDVTLDDVHRQVMLILNFVLTMGGVAYTLWVLARWWPTPSRLFLSMAGSIFVGLAEYVLYMGYIWHLSDAKKKDKTTKEVREVKQTWVVQGASEKKEQLIPSNKSAKSTTATEDPAVRRRKKETTTKR